MNRYSKNKIKLKSGKSNDYKSRIKTLQNLPEYE